MQNNPRRCLNKGIEFFRRNGRLFTGIAMTTTMLIISDKFGIPLWVDTEHTPYRTRRTSVYPTSVIIPRNPVEASILSIAKSAESMDWDSDKVRAAEDICQIVIQNNASDETRSFAITVLSDIAENLDWDNDKRRIHKLIMNIMKGSN